VSYFGQNHLKRYKRNENDYKHALNAMDFGNVFFAIKNPRSAINSSKNVGRK
jgi:hypothetical protein